MKSLLLIIMFWGSFGNAQNIVINGDFEDSGSGWQTIKTVDFFGTPLGNLGNMTAQNGTKFCGLRFYSTATASENWQEYIWRYIGGSMTAGVTYKVSIYHCLADMCTRTTDDFGVAFIEDPNYLNTLSPGVRLSLMTPQVRLKDGDFPTDDVFWTELSGYYQANGNETLTAVGCFKLDNTLDTIGIQSDHSHTQGDVYFFIDNFSITECVDYPRIDLEDEKVICEEGEVVTIDAYYPGATYLWSTGDTTSSITKDIHMTSYLSVAVTNNGFTYRDSTQILIFTEGVELDDVWFCSNGELPIERSISVNQNEQILWENGSNSATRLISESGVYSYTRSLENCNYTDTFQVIVFENDVIAYPNPGVNEINFTNSKNISVISVFTSDGELIANKPINEENLDLLIEELSPGMYFLNIEENGCSYRFKYEKILVK